MPIENYHCAMHPRAALRKVTGQAHPVCIECGLTASYGVTSTGKDPCPECGSLKYIHPQGTAVDGFCPICKKWLPPKEASTERTEPDAANSAG